MNSTQDTFEIADEYRAGHRATMPVRSEIEVCFSPESPVACCDEVLRPFWADDDRFISVCRRCGQKYTDRSQVRYGGSPWIGVDLDGTLAHDLGNRKNSKGLDEIGSPIKPMLNRLKKWLADGKHVKIFTARASSPRQVAMVKQWLASYGLPDLEVTNVKDLKMVELWDDRCVQVMTNMGEPVHEPKPAFNWNRRAGARGTTKCSEPVGILSRLRIFLTL